MSFKQIQIEKKAGIAILSFNRPDVMNALNTEVLMELERAVKVIELDDEVLVLIITGVGKAFVAGADIAEMKDKTSEEGRKFGELGSRVFRSLELMEKPVIAAVNGFALGGGCELALSCDIRIASEKAKFGQPEVSLGITPGFAGTQRLPRIIGRAKAKELIFTGKMIDAFEAEKLSLVNKVVAPEVLMEEAVDMANQIAKNAQLAVRYAKAAINRGCDIDFESANEIEKTYFGLCFATDDQSEGMEAFLERRKAEFKNK